MKSFGVLVVLTVLASCTTSNVVNAQLSACQKINRAKACRGKSNCRWTGAACCKERDSNGKCIKTFDDGGCQAKTFCDFDCETKCNANSQFCRWRNVTEYESYEYQPAICETKPGLNGLLVYESAAVAGNAGLSGFKDACKSTKPSKCLYQGLPLICSPKEGYDYAKVLEKLEVTSAIRVFGPNGKEVGTASLMKREDDTLLNSIQTVGVAISQNDLSFWSGCNKRGENDFRRPADVSCNSWTSGAPSSAGVCGISNTLDTTFMKFFKTFSCDQQRTALCLCSRK